jgi:hypothetical protein
VRAPAPEAKGPDRPAPLFAGEHRALPVAAKGRVVFSADGKRLAFLQGGNIHIVETAALLKGGAVKPPAYAKAGDKQEFLDAVFLPGDKAPLLAVTADGLKAVGPDAAANKAAAIDLPDGRPVSLSPDGKLLAVARPGNGLQIVAVGGKAGRRVALEGVTFAAWAPDGSAAYVIKVAGPDVVRVDVASGKKTTAVSGAELKKACGVEVGQVEVRAVRGAGAAEKFFLVAHQKRENARGPGTFLYPVPPGAKKRGRNPGSAEPGPGPPSWALLAAGGKLTVIDVAWKARRIDEVLVLPSKGLDQFLFAQMAQGGFAGDGGDPEVWLGRIDAAGKKSEKALPGGTFPKTMRDLHWHVLEWKDDASRALVLVQANLEVRKKIDDLIEVPLLTARYNRTGARVDGNFVVLKFQSWSLWSFGPAKGTLTRVSKLYSEKMDDLKDTVQLAGKLGTFTDAVPSHHIAYSRTAGVVALSLNSAGLFSKGKERLNPVVLIQVPAW